METWMITGVTGFLGPRVEVTLREKGEVEVLPMTREELNFTDEEQVKRVLGTLHPDVLVHAAAVSDTGACERDPEGSWKVNVTGVEYLSKACGKMERSSFSQAPTRSIRDRKYGRPTGRTRF